MIIEKTGTGKTVEEAKESALIEMGLGVDTEVDYDFEIVDLPQKKTLGLFGGNLAKVRVFREVEDDSEEALEQKKTVEKTEEAPVKEDKTEEPTEKKQPKPIGTMSDGEMSEVVNYLRTVLSHMGVRNIQTEIVSLEDGMMINIDGDKLGVAIGRKGETIDALQHLISLVANRGKDDYFRVTLNPGGYREKRESVLIGVAKKSAEKSQRIHRNVVLEPMNSYERRIIHNTVQGIDGVESWSVGENDHRRVVIGDKNNTGSYNSSYNRDRNDRNGGYNRNRSNNYHSNNNRGGYNRNNRNDRGGYRQSRPDYSVKSEKTREPIKDSSNLPLYGVVKHDDK